jgi:hypothetical protein
VMNRYNATLLLLVALATGHPAWAYVDRTPTIGTTVQQAQQIVLVEVDRFSRDNSAVILRKVRDLKGRSPDRIRHQLAAPGAPAIPGFIVEWADPGRRAVLFVSPKSTLVCLGGAWYQAEPVAEDWWRRGLDRPDLPLSYSGSITRLVDALDLILAGKSAVITVVRHGVDEEAATFDTALNRTNLPGLLKLDRVRASLRMPQWVMRTAIDPERYYVGPGAVGEEELPALMGKLTANDQVVLAETADDLRDLGKKAMPAVPRLVELLNSESPAVRMSAAAALANIAPADGSGIDTLLVGLSNPEVAVRRQAARSAALAGPAGGALGAKLGELLRDDDGITRALALQAVGTLGPAAAAAAGDAGRLLNDPTLAADAADALGRIGPAASAELPRLGAKLNADDKALCWAAARAMVQIGGSGAAPVIDYLLRELAAAREGGRDAYNIMMYFAVLGPVAEPALPRLEALSSRDPYHFAMAAWAIQPDRRFPWEAGVPGVVGLLISSDVLVWNFESVIHEIGARARPGAVSLARRIVKGDAGVPSWGYQLLVDFPDDVLPILLDGLNSTDIGALRRVIVALGYMKASAAPAVEKLEAMSGRNDDLTQRLLDGALREIGKR